MIKDFDFKCPKQEPLNTELAYCICILENRGVWWWEVLRFGGGKWWREHDEVMDNIKAYAVTDFEYNQDFEDFIKVVRNE
jgi:hypothetical protein